MALAPRCPGLSRVSTPVQTPPLSPGQTGTVILRPAATQNDDSDSRWWNSKGNVLLHFSTFCTLYHTYACL